MSAPRWESALTVRSRSRIVDRVMPMMSCVLSLELILLALPGLPGASAT